MLNPYLETWNLCSATLGRGGYVRWKYWPLPCGAAVTVAKRREYIYIVAERYGRVLCCFNLLLS